MSHDDTEKLEILNWLKETFDLDTTEEEIEIFGISSNILQKIDKLVEVSERFLMDSSDTKARLTEIREYFSQFPRTVIGIETSEENSQVVQKSQRPRYNWVEAPKLGEGG